MWDNAVVFDGDAVIGNSDQFLQWAVDNYGYKDTTVGIMCIILSLYYLYKMLLTLLKSELK